MRFVLACLLALSLSACDSGSDADVVLDGAYFGSGQVQLQGGGDPLTLQFDLVVEFQDAGPGPVSAPFTLTARPSGSVPQAYSGEFTGTLSDSGALSLGGSAEDRDGTVFPFSLSGTAATDRITADLSGTFSDDGLVLVRKG